MIRSSKISLRHANAGKQQNLLRFLAEYRVAVQQSIDYLWKTKITYGDQVFDISEDRLNLPKYVDYKAVKYTGKLSARAVCSAVEQAVSIVRSSTETRRRLLWLKAKLTAENRSTQYVDAQLIKLGLTKPTIGMDTGITNVFTSSDGQKSSTDPHGHTLSTICSKLARKTKGSKAFRAAQEHRKNYINWSINQLNLTGVKQINLEQVNLFDGSGQVSRFVSHFAHRLISEKIGMLAEEQKVSVILQKSPYKSQRCSSCGFVHMKNRKSKKFKCQNKSCGLVIGADLNAAQNNEKQLECLDFKNVKHRSLNSKGFFWNEIDQERSIDPSP